MVDEQRRYKGRDIKAADKEYLKLLETDPRGFRMCDFLPVALREWLKHYLRKSLFVKLTEEYKADPMSVLRELQDRLGLTRYEHDPKHFQRKWHSSRKPPISTELRRLVRERCRRGVEEVEELLGMEIHSKWDAALDKMASELPKVKRFNPKTRKLEWMLPD